MTKTIRRFGQRTLAAIPGTVSSELKMMAMLFYTIKQEKLFGQQVRISSRILCIMEWDKNFDDLKFVKL